MSGTSASGRKKGTPKTGGRKKGTPNKQSRILKEALILAAEAVGSDLKGKDGLVGYLIRQAKKESVSFNTMLAKTLPYQVTGPNNGPMVMITGTMTPKQAEELYSKTRTRS